MRRHELQKLSELAGLLFDKKLNKSARTVKKIETCELERSKILSEVSDITANLDVSDLRVLEDLQRVTKVRAHEKLAHIGRQQALLRLEHAIARSELRFALKKKVGLQSLLDTDGN